MSHVCYRRVGYVLSCLANVPSGSVPLNQHFEAILSVACPPVAGPPERNFGKLQKAEYETQYRISQLHIFLMLKGGKWKEVFFLASLTIHLNFNTEEKDFILRLYFKLTSYFLIILLQNFSLSLLTNYGLCLRRTAWG